MRVLRVDEVHEWPPGPQREWTKDERTEIARLVKASLSLEELREMESFEPGIPMDEFMLDLDRDVEESLRLAS